MHGEAIKFLTRRLRGQLEQRSECAVSDSRPGPAAPTPSERPDWLPDTEASRFATYRLGPPVILACYDWHPGACFKCQSENRFITVIGFRGDDGEEPVPLTMCGSCVLEQEEGRRVRMIQRGLPYGPGAIGQPE